MRKSSFIVKENKFSKNKKKYSMKFPSYLDYLKKIKFKKNLNELPDAISIVYN